MKSLYAVYLILALGAGAITWSVVGMLNDVNEDTVLCDRLEGFERDQCMKDVSRKANAALAAAKALTEPVKQDAEK